MISDLVLCFPGLRCALVFGWSWVDIFLEPIPLKKSRRAARASPQLSTYRVKATKKALQSHHAHSTAPPHGQRSATLHRSPTRTNSRHPHHLLGPTPPCPCMYARGYLIPGFAKGLFCMRIILQTLMIPPFSREKDLAFLGHVVYLGLSGRLTSIDLLVLSLSSPVLSGPTGTKRF